MRASQPSSADGVLPKNNITDLNDASEPHTQYPHNSLAAEEMIAVMLKEARMQLGIDVTDPVAIANSATADGLRQEDTQYDSSNTEPAGDEVLSNRLAVQSITSPNEKRIDELKLAKADLQRSLAVAEAQLEVARESERNLESRLQSAEDEFEQLKEDAEAHVNDQERDLRRLKQENAALVNIASQAHNVALNLLLHRDEPAPGVDGDWAYESCSSTPSGIFVSHPRSMSLQAVQPGASRGGLWEKLREELEDSTEVPSLSQDLFTVQKMSPVSPLPRKLPTPDDSGWYSMSDCSI